jgi:subtilisin-like proprotein convertase family protein
MRKQLLLAFLTFTAVLPVPAALFSAGNVSGSGTALNLGIPDGTYPAGVSSTIGVSGLGGSLSSVTVTLNIAGGFNGDLYGYLSYNGTLVTLLNHVGTGSGDAFQSAAGYSTSGFNSITLADGGAGGNIHDVASPVSGVSYGPDGGTLASFNSMNPNGTWTLFLADNATPNQSTLEGWSLDITAVPEPVNTAMAIFGLVGISAGATRCYLARRRRQTPPATN